VVNVDLAPRPTAFGPSEQIALVEVFACKVWTVRPVTVIRDDLDEIAVWIAPGAVAQYPAGPQHGVHTINHWLTRDWTITERVWRPPGKLIVTRPGDGFTVAISPPGANGDTRDWYVNLQEPLQRVEAGFRTMDMTLDLVVSHDLATWHWKDEDEFAYAQHTGLYDPDVAAAIRTTGQQVIDALATGTPPWNPNWATWTPGLASRAAADAPTRSVSVAGLPNANPRW
jgi:uncharacterized protein DUF402